MTQITCLQFVNLSAFLHRHHEATTLKLQETRIFHRYKNSAGEQQAFYMRKTMEIRKDFSIKGTNSQFLNTLKSADVTQSVLR